MKGQVKGLTNNFLYSTNIKQYDGTETKHIDHINMHDRLTSLFIKETKDFQID